MPTPCMPTPKRACVHHHEHVLEAAVLLADEVADGAAVVAEREHRGRARVDAELVLERHAAHVVARAEAAVRVHEELRHDEQRDALGARRRVGRAREDEVDDVVGVVVLAVGDEDLAAVDPVAAVALRHRLRADRGEIGAGLRLGQVHRAGPLAGDHLRQVGALERVGAVAARSPRSRLRSASGTARTPCSPRSTSRRPPPRRGAACPGRRSPGSSARPFQPSSQNLPVGVLESGRRASRCRRRASARPRGRRPRFSGSSTSVANLPASSRIAATVSGVASS